MFQTISQNEKHPRHVQHALLTDSAASREANPSARQWYPRILELAANPEPEFRLLPPGRWLRQQGGRIHQTCLKVLHDNEPLVAAGMQPALVRFNDPSGRNELLGT